MPRKPRKPLIAGHPNPDMSDPVVAAANKPGFKFCTTCGKRKALEDFHKDDSKADGHRDTCKMCRKEINARARDARRKKQIQELENQGLDALGKMSSGGSLDPHINEVFEAIMRPFGGVNGYAKHLFATYLACDPGSQRRIKIHEMIIRLADKVTKMGLAERQLEMMEERDLKRVLEKHMLEYKEQTGYLPSASVDDEEVEDAVFE
jgi:hypothetical protein